MVIDRCPICRKALNKKRVWSNKKPDKIGVLRRITINIAYCETCDFIKIPLRVGDYKTIKDLTNRFNNIDVQITCGVCGQSVTVKKNSICYDYNLCVFHAKEKYYKKWK